MKVQNVSIQDVKPYVNNPRDNDGGVDANKQADNSPEYKYNRAMQRYNAERERLKRVNAFRQKHGKVPLAMPKRPKKASFGLKKGKKPSTGKSSG